LSRLFGKFSSVLLPVYLPNLSAVSTFHESGA
jgi:hypothetical protein